MTDLKDTTQLVLGPFHGQVACQRIKFGRGVCGKAAQDQETQIIADVELFPGHIACDSKSRSEIVVPIVLQGRTIAVIDVDCEEVNGFDEVDRVKLKALANLLADGCDW